MSVLIAVGVAFIGLAIGGYIVSIIRPEHRHDKDEHEEFTE